MQAVVEAANKAKEDIDNLVNRCTPYCNDKTITVYYAEIHDLLTCFNIYEDLLLKLQEELNFKELKPGGLHSNGVCPNINTWKDALEIRNHASIRLPVSSMR